MSNALWVDITGRSVAVAEPGRKFLIVEVTVADSSRLPLTVDLSETSVLDQSNVRHKLIGVGDCEAKLGDKRVCLSLLHWTTWTTDAGMRLRASSGRWADPNSVDDPIAVS
jgi:hypothetical protein